MLVLAFSNYLKYKECLDPFQRVENEEACIQPKLSTKKGLNKY